MNTVREIHHRYVAKMWRKGEDLYTKFEDDDRERLIERSRIATKTIRSIRRIVVEDRDGEYQDEEIYPE